MFTYGSSIGSGNYFPVVNEITYLDNPITSLTFAASTVLYIRQLSMEKIPSNTKAIVWDASARIQTSSSNASGSAYGGYIGCDANGNQYSGGATGGSIVGVMRY
jgi:hypothetical protein